MTMDGKIATRTGASRWITDEAARERVHQDRNRYAGIMVGVGTVLADNPMLDCRIENGRNPVRIVCDSTLRTPIASRLVATANEIPTIILTLRDDKGSIQPYLAKNCKIITVPIGKGGKLDLEYGLKKVAEMGIDSILLEGGATLNASMLRTGLVQKVQAYIAPKIFGGKDAPSPVAGLGVSSPADAYKLINTKTTILGVDILIESEVELVK